MTTTAGRNGTFPRDARSAAELYLAKRLAPIPLPPRSKDPGYADWQHLRLTADALDQHFPPQEVRNVGILNGAPSNNALDVDLDCPEALRAAPLLLPPTGWVFGRQTAPCSHRIYQADRPLDTAQEAFKDLDGKMLVELRGTGGLTVYPPSAHKETGELIAWDRFTEPAEVALGDLRQAVGELAAATLLARHWPCKGSRDAAAMALSGGLVRAGWPEEKVSRFVEAVAVAAGDEQARMRAGKAGPTAQKVEDGKKVTGWPKLAEVLGDCGEAVVRRVREWLGLVRPPAAPGAAATKVRALEPYRPFPVEALPAPLGEYVRQGALALGCDPAYLALPALAVAASVIGNTCTIRLKGGWDEPSVLWAAIIGDSGTLKSPAYLKAVAHLFRLQRRLLLAFKENKARYQDEQAAYQAARRQAQDGGPDPGEPPEEPVLQRVVCSDTTIEKLAEILEDNPRGTLVARDELAGWLGSFTRYKQQKGGTDLPNWLEMHRAGTVIVDRKTSERPTLFIQRAAVSIAGGSQPGVLARVLTPEFLDAGLAARLLMAMPPKLPKRWSEAEVAPEVEQAYQDALDRLLALDFDSIDGEKAPHALRLSREGKAVWVEFYDDWAREQAAAEGELAAAFSKLEAYAARLALVHHVVSRVARGDADQALVERESVEAGVTLCRWFAGEARRVHATLSESTEERDTRRLVEFIQARGGRITVRGLMRANCRRYPNADAAESALAVLVEAGLARWIEPQTGTKGGKPIKAVELCMTHDTDDTGPRGDGDDGPTADDSEPDTGPDADPGTGPVSPAEADCDRVTRDPEGGVIGVMRHAGGTATDANGEAGTGRCHAREAGADPAVMRSPFVVEARGPSAPTYLLVKDRAGLDVVAAALNDTALVGLDVETTGLDPHADRVRLLSLALDTIDGGKFAYLVDCFAVDPAPLWKALADRELVLHNAAFDLAFLARRGFTPAGNVRDTMLLAQLLTAGTMERVSLAACCRRWLQRDLDKAEQKSDWSGALTDDQLAYAALDVVVLAPLLKALAAEVEEAGLAEVARIEQRCLPAIVWMGWQGVALDRDAWQALAGAASEEADRLRQELHQAAPPKPCELFDAWNWDSTPQARQALALAGCEVDNTAEETLAAVDHPLAQLLRRYRLARKRSSTYGTDWLAHVAGDGRVYPSWRQIGAASGRMSCSDPNMQQLPRGEYRRCVVAPPGRVLVKADYSQIELRIAAKVSGDRALLEAYRRGEDLHARTARNVLRIEDVTKQHRQLAKALNFGLLYGMGARGLRQYARSQYGLELTEEEARRYRNAFFRSYPGLAAWHSRVRSQKTTQTRTLAGRRRLLNDRTPDTHRLNTPVQGTGADGLKLALALLWERRDQAPGAFPVLVVHDEIVVECDAGQAEAAAAWLKQAMIDGMAPLIEPVPCEVEVQVGQTWGG
jgi:DNA polymerase I-like protein with 3'-5' exonuclease and polymerase domains